jgi:hypothetical protein
MRCRFDEIEKHLGKIPEAGEGLLLAAFTTYHALFPFTEFHE